MRSVSQEDILYSFKSDEVTGLPGLPGLFSFLSRPCLLLGPPSLMLSPEALLACFPLSSCTSTVLHLLFTTHSLSKPLRHTPTSLSTFSKKREQRIDLKGTAPLRQIACLGNKRGYGQASWISRERNENCCHGHSDTAQNRWS